MFTHAIVRTPGSDAADGLTTAALGRADLPTLLRQHSAYVATLEELGLTLTRLDPLPGHPDAYFVEDAALLFPELAIITRPGAPERLAEAEAIAPAVAVFRTVHRLTAPATLDGGDVLQVDRTVFVGLSERTNAEGAAQLAAILAPHGYRVVPIPVPEGLHFKSSITWAGGDTLVLTPALASRPELAGYRPLVVPAEETYAANVLWINGTLLMPKGFPRTQALLGGLGLPLRVLDQSEARKMDGALTCLSLRF
jgi:dimethylargininase